MANFRRRMRSFGSRAYGRVKTVYVKTRARVRRPVSFIKKNKTILIIVALLGLGYFFKDKIKTLLKIA